MTLNSHITYSFDSPNVTINLDVLELLQFQEVALMDDVNNHVCNQITAVWKTILSPALNSYRLNGKVPEQFDGEFPTGSEEALIYFLEQPRGHLKWTLDGRTQLETPRPGKYVDSRNGPVPKVIAIEKAHGTRTFEITWQVVTWVSQAHRHTNKTPLLLSNTWGMTTTLNEQFLETRHIQGRAIFDLAEMPKDHTADDYRGWVMPVCPRGFKRFPIVITVTEDGAELLYQVTDTQQRARLEIPGVAKVAINRSADIVVPGFGQQLMSMAESVFGGFGGSLASAVTQLDKSVASKPQNKKPIGQAASNVAGSTLGALRSMSVFLPSLVSTVEVQCWGTAEMSLFRLTNIAIQICDYHLNSYAIESQALGRALFGGLFVTNSFHIRHDPVNCLVVVSKTVSCAIAGGVAADAAMIGLMQNLHREGIRSPRDYVPVGNFNLVHQPAPQGDGLAAAPPFTIPAVQSIVPEAINQNAVDSSVPPDRQKPGGAPHSRGAFVGKIFGQLLQGPTEKPGEPPLPVAAKKPKSPNRSSF